MAEVVGKFDSLQFGDKIYQVKLPNDLAVQIECDHEYEITGKTGHEYAVAIPDGPVVISRINGQTRRKSLNLFNDYKEITINAGSEQWIMWGDTDLINWGLVVGKKYSVIFYSAPNDITGNYYKSDNTDWKNINSTSVLNFTMNKGYSLRIGGNSVSQKVTFKPELMIVEGTYTLDTMPPFEPYDNTLVNSKCNLRSTGRNFYSSNDFYSDQDVVLSGTTITSGNNDYVGVLPKRKFVFLKGVTYHFRKLNATGTLPYGRIIVKGTPWSSSIAENGDAWYFDTDSTSFTAPQNIELESFRFVKKTSSDSYSFDLQITIENSEELIPYEESTCEVNVELGEYDYIDNQSHLLINQTSSVITCDGSSDEYWGAVDSQAGATSKLYKWAPFTSDHVEANKGVSNMYGEANESIWLNDEKCFGISTGENAVFIRVPKDECPDVNSFRAWLKNNNFQFVYKKVTPTTETLQVKSGYQVWNSGLQIQETETIPYILEKEYAISVYDQILSNTEIISSINTPQVEDTTLVM